MSANTRDNRRNKRDNKDKDKEKDTGAKTENVRAEKPPQRQQKPKAEAPPMTQAEEANRQMYERTLYMTMNLVGRVVQVQVKSGATYEGIFHTAKTEQGFGVVLKMARKREPGTTVLGPVSATLIIQPKDFVQIVAKDVTFDESEGALDDAFMTDTDISGHTDMRERELQPWVPDSNVSSDLSLHGSSGSSNWDQFEVNAKLFGVKTSYEEEIYTTKLDRQSHNYKEQSRMAQRIADEIEGKVATNAHLAEERGQIGMDDMDEEEKYSSVIRSGVYVPPGKRNQQAHAGENNQDLRGSSELDESGTSPKDKVANASVAERLRLRKALVNETHRTSPTPNNDKPISPLTSPLVGDAKTITALGLEPRAPPVPEGVALEFLNFSLNEKAKQNPLNSRQAVTDNLKQFSATFKRPESPHGAASAPAAAASTAPSSTSTTAPSTTTPATPAASTTSTSASATPAAASASTSSTASSLTLRPLSKLNPNAKAFTPMSANAPVFTPKSFVPASAPAPVMPPPAEHGTVFFHPPPMQPHPIPHHPGAPPPHHLQPAPMVSDPRPLAEIYSEGMKRKTHQEKSETTQPFWYGTRGSYRTNVEDMDPALHRPPSSFPPNAPPAMGVVGMHAIPVGPVPPHPLQPSPISMGHNFPPPPYVNVIPNAPMGMGMMGPPPVPIAVGGPPQPPVVAGPIFMGQPGMRPYPPHPGVHPQNAPIGMGGQPPYGYPPQLTHPAAPLSPPPHQPRPQSPSSSPQAPQSPQPQHVPPHMYQPQPSHFSPSHPQHSIPSPGASPASPASPAQTGAPKRAYFSPSQAPQSPTQPHQGKPGYTPQQQPRT